MKRVLITGIDGFVGLYMAHYLLEKGYEVSGTSWSFVDREELKELGDQVRQVKVNILDTEALSLFVHREKPDAVIHLAAQSSIPQSWTDPVGTIQINIEGTYNLFLSIMNAGLDIPVLIVGAAAEYGHVKSDGSLISEEDPFHPDNPYAVSKVGEEMIAYQYHISHGIHSIRARPFTHVGPGQESRFVCSEFSRTIAMMEKESLPREMHVGDLAIRRDFLDVRDVVNAYHLLISSAAAGEVYNVCSSAGTSIGMILEMLRQHSEIEFDVTVDSSKFRENEALAIVGDNSKIRTQLGWQPQYDISTTLLDMLNYWRERV